MRVMQDIYDHSYTQQHLRSIIIHGLDNLSYGSAEFASERLLADDEDNLDSVYLYCLTLYKQEKFKSCYNRSSNLADHLGCSYIYARLCLQLKKYQEGIFQLLKVGYLYNESSTLYQNKYNPTYFASPQSKYHYESTRSILPDLSVIYHLLGDLYRGMGDMKNSALNYSEALKYNQFDFEAFQELCKLGVDVKVKATFRPKNGFNPMAGPPPLKDKSLSVPPHNDFGGGGGISGGGGGVGGGISGGGESSVSNPFAGTPNAHASLKTTTEKQQQQQLHLSSNPDESFNSVLISSPKVKSSGTLDPILKRPGPGSLAPEASNTMKFEFTKPSFPLESTNASGENVGAKKSKRESTYSKITSRLISQPSAANKKTGDNNNSTASTANNINKRTNVRSGLKRNNTNGISHSINNNSEAKPPLSLMMSKEIELGNDHLLDLYSIFAKAFKCLSKYDCYKAIRILESLPQKEKETPWVLSTLGMLHYEIVNYKQSEYFFVKLRRLDRTRLEGMEYYSTLLWHLHKKTELTYLANELHDLDPKSPITWCTIGNLFSLTREPDEAIKCFNKAIKLDETFTYAYTLKGHEYFGNDNYEMALENFRISLLIDSRHYNALYGIGMVYINLGDYQKADYHFRKAISINPINIILICCVGMVLEKVGKKNLALRQYELANKLQPLNPLPIFKKAQLLFSMQQFQQALHYFEILRESAPDEASVHFLLGQLYNIQNNKFQAIKEFTIALNLDPKGNYLIREAMEASKDQ